MTIHSSQPRDDELQRRPEPLAALLECDPPLWEGPAATADCLLAHWAAVYRLTRAAVAWRDASTGQPNLVVWPPDPPEAGAASDSVAALAWRALPASRRAAAAEASEFRLGLAPEERWTEIDEETLTASGRLLGWSAEIHARCLARRMESIAEFAAGAGHEINNPLGTIVGRTGQLLKDEGDPDRRRQLELIGAQAYRIRDMIGDAMLFARPPEPRFEAVNLVAAIREAVSALEERRDSASATVRVDASPELFVRADAVQLRIVLAELLRNACEAQASLISLRAAPIDRAAAEGAERGAPAVLLTVSDNGRGFTPPEREHCFDPFYSGRQAGRGLGFGLPKCWRILEKHAAAISLHSREEETEFAIVWPAATPPQRGHLPEEPGLRRLQNDRSIC